MARYREERPQYEDKRDDEEREALDDERDDPQDCDLNDDDDDDELDALPCPACRRDVLAEAERCPHCGEFLDANRARSQPPWVILTAAILLGVAGLYYLSRM